MVNKSKTTLCSVEDGGALRRERTTNLAHVRADSWHGLLVQYCEKHGIKAIVKGLRAVSDFDYELQMAQMNQQLSGIDTLFMPTSPVYSFLSSSLVKEVAKYGGDVSHLLPAQVHQRVLDRLAEQRASES